MSNTQYNWSHRKRPEGIREWYLSSMMDPYLIRFTPKTGYCLHTTDDLDRHWDDARQIAGPFKTLRAAKLTYIILTESLYNG